MMDLHVFFESAAPPDKFENVDQELDAVSSGDKAMSVITFARADLGNEEFQTVIISALDRNLFVTYHIEKIMREGAAYEQLYLFMLKAEQIWRIHAYLATRRILREYPWNDGLEYLESYLLGYSEKDALDWIAYKHRTRAGWTGLTIYLLVSEREAERIRYLGMRCLDPHSVGDDMIAFFSRSNLALRADAKTMIPKSMVLLRTAVKRSVFELLFGPAKGWESSEIVSARITRHTAELMNPALETNFQILEESGWR